MTTTDELKKAAEEAGASQAEQIEAVKVLQNAIAQTHTEIAKEKDKERVEEIKESLEDNN
ncbi:MAG: hypothetical protein CMI52_04195 [Parcubacteria group bacterium]|nr:hypothetical protein [Parcubacteria group bacterium]